MLGQVDARTTELAVRRALGGIELAALEGAGVGGVGERVGNVGERDARKLLEEFGASLPHELGELGLVVGEVQEGRGGRELLPLKEHRGLRPEEQEGGEGAPSPRTRQAVQPVTARRVGDLIVVLEIVHEALAREAERRAPASLPLPLVALALVQESVLGGGDELLGPAAVVAVVGLVASGERDEGRMVKVVVPQGVERVSAFAAGREQPRLLRFVLTNDQRAARAAGTAHRVDDLAEDVGRGAIEDALCGVEAEPVEMVLLDPVPRVVEEEVAHRLAVGPVEIDRVAPLGREIAPEVVLRELPQVVAARTQVIVHDVEHHAESEAMGLVHEVAELVRRAVVMIGGEEIHAVVAPPERAGELGDGHYLEQRDPHLGEGRELARGRPPRSVRREGADVHLVRHLSLETHARPLVVRPVEQARVHHFRRAVRPVGLVAGGRIGIACVAIQAKAISRAGADVGHESGEVSVAVPLQGERPSRGGRARLHYDFYLRPPGSPHAEMHAAVAHFRPDGQPPRGRRLDGAR